MISFKAIYANNYKYVHYVHSCISTCTYVHMQVYIIIISIINNPTLSLFDDIITSVFNAIIVSVFNAIIVFVFDDTSAISVSFGIVISAGPVFADCDQ